MKRSNRSIILLFSLATATLFAGCSTPGPVVTRSDTSMEPVIQLKTESGTKSTTNTVNARPIDSIDDRPAGIDFGDRPVVVQRPYGIVGIYGEAISNSPTTSGFGDGASNISQVTFTREGADFDPQIDPTGKWIVYASTQHRETSDIYLKSTNGTTITQLTKAPEDDMMPEFSPDGQWVAFASNRGGNFDIYIMPTTGGQARLISNDAAHELHPSWSPDGKNLVYCKFGRQSQRWELWTVNVENSSVRNFVDYGFLPRWSPDPVQSKIVFQRARERGSRYHSIWTIDYLDGQGRNPTEIVSAGNAAIINPSWSPGGSHIVFATVVEPESKITEKPSSSDLWIVRLDGRGRTNLIQGESANFQPTWGTDRRVYFVSDRSGTDNLWSVAARFAIDNYEDLDPGDSIVTVPDYNN